MKELKRIERYPDGDFAWDTEIPKLIATKCKEFVKSILETEIGEYDLSEVEFIIHCAIDMEFNLKRVLRRQEWVNEQKEKKNE
jgi:hypothetical protein